MVTAVKTTAFGKFTPDADIEIKAAAGRYNLDPRFLRAIIASESSGDWETNNRIAQYSGGQILPYIGMKDRMWKRHGVSSRDLNGDRYRQIFILARQLADMKYGFLGSYDSGYEELASTWYCGSPKPTDYADQVLRFMGTMGEF